MVKYTNTTLTAPGTLLLTCHCPARQQQCNAMSLSDKMTQIATGSEAVIYDLNKYIIHK